MFYWWGEWPRKRNQITLKKCWTYFNFIFQKQIKLLVIFPQMNRFSSKTVLVCFKIWLRMECFSLASLIKLFKRSSASWLGRWTWCLKMTLGTQSSWQLSCTSWMNSTSKSSSLHLDKTQELLMFLKKRKKLTKSVWMLTQLCLTWYLNQESLNSLLRLQTTWLIKVWERKLPLKSIHRKLLSRMSNRRSTHFSERSRLVCGLS